MAVPGGVAQATTASFMAPSREYPHTDNAENMYTKQTRAAYLRQ